jgi:hypothetical protein
MRRATWQNRVPEDGDAPSAGKQSKNRHVHVPRQLLDLPRSHVRPEKPDSKLLQKDHHVLRVNLFHELRVIAERVQGLDQVLGETEGLAILKGVRSQEYTLQLRVNSFDELLNVRFDVLRLLF